MNKEEFDFLSEKFGYDKNANTFSTDVFITAVNKIDFLLALNYEERGYLKKLNRILVFDRQYKLTRKGKKEMEKYGKE